MLPLTHKILFLIFALVAGGIGLYGFYRLYLRIRRGAAASEWRWNDAPQRIGYALWTSLTQERTFRRRPWISVLHSFIFYGFTYYLLVNVIDGLEGYLHFSISSANPLGAVYNFLADLLSFGVLVGVLGLLYRRIWGRSRRDFRFTEKTLLHPAVERGYIKRDSLIVSSFILFHVGSRILGNAAKMVEEARLHSGQYDWLQPFSTLLGSATFGNLSEGAIQSLRLFGFWGALGSILAFLAYFPFSKHIHIFMAPVNYALKRPVGSGVIPPMKGLAEAMEQEEPKLGVEKLEDLEWPRLLDAYACIQCNRCQDVCPANATGKALSPAALEINKRMELNVIAAQHTPFTLKPVPFEAGAPTDRPLLEYAINEESVWACTTCGACMQVCPVQDEQMLDIIDIRRHQVMVAGEFPPQLQTAFRGMERASNPWGISRDKRMEWAEGLKVPTIDENPEPDVIYWVGCAASYDPGAQKVARSFVQLLDRAGVNYAVLGKKEACTGDSARRAGNEFLYQQLAAENVETLNTVAPKLIVATCPHCMNAIGNEYRQLGGDYRTIHHTEYLEELVRLGKLPTAELHADVTYHDPCYLGRHNGVYDAPRTLITRMAGEVLKLERERENSFCCGAGGAQFWKEEEEGRERVSDNRFRELQARLDTAAANARAYEEGQPEKVVAVGCPFCKSMMNSTPEKAGRDDIIVKDVAELLLESVERATGTHLTPTGPLPDASPIHQPEFASAPNALTPMHRTGAHPASGTPVAGETNADFINHQPGSPRGSDGTHPEPQAAHPEEVTARKAWKPKDTVTGDDAAPAAGTRKAWKPGAAQAQRDDVVQAPIPEAAAAPAPEAPARKSWKPRAATDDVQAATPATDPTATPTASTDAAPARKAWKPKAGSDDVNPAPVTPSVVEPTPTEGAEASGRKAWKPRAAPAAEVAETPAPAAPPAETATSPATAAPGERKKWAPKAAAPAADVIVASPQPEPVEPMAPAPINPEPTEVAPATGERKKWTPKATTTPPQPVEPVEAAPQAEPAPITEHVHLEQVGENLLEEGEQATSEPGVGGRKKWVPKKKD